MNVNQVSPEVARAALRVRSSCQYDESLQGGAVVALVERVSFLAVRDSLGAKELANRDRALRLVGARHSVEA